MQLLQHINTARRLCWQLHNCPLNPHHITGLCSSVTSGSSEYCASEVKYLDL